MGEDGEVCAWSNYDALKVAKCPPIMEGMDGGKEERCFLPCCRAGDCDLTQFYLLPFPAAGHDAVMAYLKQQPRYILVAWAELSGLRTSGSSQDVAERLSKGIAGGSVSMEFPWQVLCKKDVKSMSKSEVQSLLRKKGQSTTGDLPALLKRIRESEPSSSVEGGAGPLHAGGGANKDNVTFDSQNWEEFAPESNAAKISSSGAGALHMQQPPFISNNDTHQGLCACRHPGKSEGAVENSAGVLCQCWRSF